MKQVLSHHSKIDKTKVLKPCGILMYVKSNAERSMGSFCNTIDLLSSPYLSLKTLWSSFEWLLKTGFTVQRYSISKVQRGGGRGRWGDVGKGICEQSICYHVAAFMILFNVICNMTMFWKSWIMTYWPHPQGREVGRGGLQAKYLLPSCYILDSLIFDMQHDHV